MDLLHLNHFSKISLRNTVRVANSLDPDQAHHFVRPDLGPNCLQRLSAANTKRKELSIHTHACSICILWGNRFTSWLSC